MKTIKHISLWVVVATCMVAVSTRGNAQAVSSTYFNVDWQFNAPVGNSYADKASGWGMNFEGGYYVMPKILTNILKSKVMNIFLTKTNDF